MGNLPRHKRIEFESLLKAFRHNCETAKILRGYIYGSYSQNKPLCGDLDVFATISRAKVKDYIKEEKRKLSECEREGFWCGECEECDHEDDNDEDRALPSCFWGECPENFGKENELDSQLQSEFFKSVRKDLIRGFKEIRLNEGYYHFLPENPKIFLQLAIGYSCKEYGKRFDRNPKPKFKRIFS